MEARINELAEEGWKFISSSVATEGPYLIFYRLEELPVDRTTELLANIQKD